METLISAIIYAIVFLFGTAIGSFINCLVWREHNNMRVADGRSRCVHCGRQLRWYENIPIFSYLFLAGKCHTCHKKIPGYYLLTEFFTGVLFLFVFWLDLYYFHFSWRHLIGDLILLAFLVTIFVGDVLYRVIWPEVVWLGLVAGAAYNFFSHGASWRSMVLGFVIGGGFFLAQHLLSQGRWVGGGDVRLGAMMGVWLGWPVILVAIFAAYILGAIVAVPLLIFKKKNWSTAVPFGPFLAIATFWALNHGERVVNWYVGLLK
ncbi:MAG: prepilin peptidase [Patescibacteria group bacterium]|nr:prepilin peptidase [Patescibacteria group bacterium]